jgi:hypothetical protein
MTSSTQCRATQGSSLALLGFIWLNAVLLRTLHQWTGIAYELGAMLRSTIVESALSIFRAFLALTTMLIAAGRDDTLGKTH